MNDPLGTGTIALVGGGEFLPECDDLDRDLLQRSGGTDVLVLPTAAAYEHPKRAVATAVAHFERLGATAAGLFVLARPDASDPEFVRLVRQSRFIYLTGGSPMHLRSVLKATPLWTALGEALADGAVLAGSSAGAMVLTDPMSDPRGGAFTLGLGLVHPLAVIPHHETWTPDLARRTVETAPKGIPVVALNTAAAVVRSAGAPWQAYGKVSVFIDGHLTDLDALPT